MGLMEMGESSTQGWFSPPLRGDPQAVPSFSCGCWGGHGEGLPEERTGVKRLIFPCNGARELPFALLMPSP